LAGQAQAPSAEKPAEHATLLRLTFTARGFHFPFQLLDAVIGFHQRRFLRKGRLRDAIARFRIAREKLRDQPIGVRVNRRQAWLLRRAGAPRARGRALSRRIAAHPLNESGNDPVFLIRHCEILLPTF
jgi:hypothetical protein